MATIEIAQIWSTTSRIRAGVESGFGRFEDTVSSCVLVQNSASPKVLIPVPGLTLLGEIDDDAGDEVKRDRGRQQRGETGAQPDMHRRHPLGDHHGLVVI